MLAKGKIRNPIEDFVIILFCMFVVTYALLLLAPEMKVVYLILLKGL